MPYRLLTDDQLRKLEHKLETKLQLPHLSLLKEAGMDLLNHIFDAAGLLYLVRTEIKHRGESARVD